ncbi:MAG: ArsR/SmtB family transcription factor [Thermoleophilia bacterium]
MKSTIKKIGRDRIELLRIIGHPLRVEILEQLEGGVKCVSDLGDFLETSQPNISQHLGMLRRAGLIDFYMDGRLRCYFLVDPIVPEMLRLLRKQYEEDLEAPACCPVTRTGKYPGARKH